MKIQQKQHQITQDEARGHRDAAENIVLDIKIPPHSRIGAEQEHHQNTGYDVQNDKIQQSAACLGRIARQQRQHIVERDAADGDDKDIRKHQNKFSEVELTHETLNPFGNNHSALSFLL